MKVCSHHQMLHIQLFYQVVRYKGFRWKCCKLFAEGDLYKSMDPEFLNKCFLFLYRHKTRSWENDLANHLLHILKLLQCSEEQLMSQMKSVKFSYGYRCQWSILFPGAFSRFAASLFPHHSDTGLQVHH